MATTKPTKPSITLPSAFGTSASNVKTPFTSQELIDGYSASIQQILDGGNVNWLNDTMFKYLTYTTAIVDWLNGISASKVPFINSSNQLDSATPVLASANNTFTGNNTFNNDVVALGLLKGTTETGSSLTNHAISIGHQNQNHMDFYEYGGTFNFYKSQTGTNTPLFEINPSWVRALNNVLVENTNPGIVLKNNSITKGTAPSSAVYKQIKFVDLYSSYLGGFEQSYETDKSSSIQMFCSDNSSASGSNVKSYIKCKVSSSGVGFTEVTAPTEDTTSSVQIDTVGARNTKLGNYAKLDGSNLQTGTGSGKIRCIKETYSNGTEWYRVWSDGWIEQGGSNLSGGNTGTQNLNKVMPNTNYTVIVSGYANGSSFNTTMYYYNKTTTSFVTYGMQCNGWSWYVCGYGS